MEYVIYLFSKILGNIPCSFGNLSIFWGKSPNSLGKNMVILICGIFPNNGWGKFHKKYVIHFFSKILENVPCYFWNVSIFLGESMFTLKCEIPPNNSTNFLQAYLYPQLLNSSINLTKLHWEKRFDWMKENDLFERLSLI